MDVLLICCDSGGPARHLRLLEMGICHQMLADAGCAVASLRLEPGQDAAQVVAASAPGRLIVMFADEFGAWALHAPKAVRRVHPGTPLAVAGVFPTLDPERAIAAEGVDMLVVGEADLPLMELASQLGRGGDISSLRNVWMRRGDRIERNPLRPAADALDALPFANRDLLDALPLQPDGPVVAVAASRGCPYDCQFCYSPQLKRVYESKGPYHRVRSPQNVAAEVLAESRRCPDARVVFVDEVFPTDRDWLQAFSSRVKGRLARGVTVPVIAERCDAATLDLLRECGCDRIVLGVETGSDAFRRRLSGRNLSGERLRQLAHDAAERGMRLEAHCMAGLQLESAPLLQETERLLGQLAPVRIHLRMFQPVPGSGLAVGACDDAPPDFGLARSTAPDLTTDALRAHQTRLHFAAIATRIADAPAVPGYYDFVRELPRARFVMKHPSDVDAGVTAWPSRPMSWLKLMAGAEVRFAHTPGDGDWLVFSLLVAPGTTTGAPGGEGRVAAEVLWRDGEGEHLVFQRMLTQAAGGGAARWQKCACPFPDEFVSAGEVAFRARAVDGGGAAAAMAVVWGEPCLRKEGAAIPSSVAELESCRRRITELEAAASDLSSQLEAAREAEAKARAERDEKARRVAELHGRLVELEGQVEELARQLAAHGGGIADRLKGLFKKP